MTESKRNENRALFISAVAFLSMGVLGVGFFMLTRSEAILLDGVYSLISFVMTLLARRVARLVETPGNEDFHFGFAHFEPLLNTVRILLILTITVVALVSAITSMFHGGRALSPGYAVLYAVLAASGCVSMAMVQRRYAKKAKSPLLDVEAHTWFVDGLLSAGVGITFLIAFFMQDTRFADWLPYVDPLLVIVMVVAILPAPLQTLKENLADVLMIAPERDRQAEIRAKVENAVVHLKPELIHIRMLPMGRWLYLHIHIMLAPDHKIRNIGELDEIRQHVSETLHGIHPRLGLDIAFTGNKRWAGLDSYV